MLNESGKSGHPSLVPDFRGNAFSFSTLSVMLAVGLSYMAFYIEICPYIPTLLRIFLIINEVGLWQNLFPSTEMII